MATAAVMCYYMVERFVATHSVSHTFIWPVVRDIIVIHIQGLGIIIEANQDVGDSAAE